MCILCGVVRLRIDTRTDIIVVICVMHVHCILASVWDIGTETYIMVSSLKCEYRH